MTGKKAETLTETTKIVETQRKTAEAARTQGVTGKKMETQTETTKIVETQ